MSYEPNDPDSQARSGDFQPSNSGKSGSKTTASAEKSLTCAICGSQFLRSQTVAMPFCRPRCRQVDLGRWLNEGYGFPHEGEGARENFNSDPDEEVM